MKLQSQILEYLNTSVVPTIKSLDNLTRDLTDVEEIQLVTLQELSSVLSEALDAEPEISLEQASEEIQTHDGWVEYMDLQEILSPYHIANLVTFENSHEVAQSLAINSPLEATALLDELLYWRNQGRI